MLLRLPDEHREAFREPLGPIETETDDMLAEVEGPLITVGDVVTYHCEEAGRVPDVAVVDGRSQREAVRPEIEHTLAASAADRLHAENPAGTITASLIETLRMAISRDEPVQVVVEGEEDLAAIPAMLLAPDGSTVVYGQPDVGMVAVTVDIESRAVARELLDKFDGDHDRVAALLSE